MYRADGATKFINNRETKMKIPKIHQWTIAFAIVGAVLMTIFAPASFWAGNNIFIYGVCAIVFCIIVQFITTHFSQDIPRSAVLELLDRCQDEAEWVIVHFKPKVSIEEAQIRLGPSYTQEARERGFMFKATNVHASRSDIVVFYSKQKGLLCANPEAIKFLLGKYGKFLIDNWNCLLGAMFRNNLRAQNLDGGQLFTGNGEYIGNANN